MFIQKLVGITDKPPNIWLVSKIPEIFCEISVPNSRLVVPTLSVQQLCASSTQTRVKPIFFAQSSQGTPSSHKPRQKNNKPEHQKGINFILYMANIHKPFYTFV